MEVKYLFLFAILAIFFNFSATEDLEKNTTNRLNITVVFGKLANNERHRFKGTLKLPLENVGPEGLLRMRIRNVHFKNGRTLRRTVNLGNETTERLSSQMYVAFEPYHALSEPRSINIKYLKLVEETVTDGTVEGGAITHEFFPIENNGTINYPHATLFERK